MDLARTLIADKGLSEPFAVMCRFQTAGRGRGGSRWTQASELGLTETQLTDADRVEEAPDFVSGVRRGKFLVLRRLSFQLIALEFR